MENEEAAPVEAPAPEPAESPAENNETGAAEVSAAPAEPAFNVFTSDGVDWMDDPTLAGGPGLTKNDFDELPAGAKRVIAKARAEYKQNQAKYQSDLEELRTLKADMEKLKINRLKELADLQRHVQRDRFRALDKPVEVPNVDPSSTEYIQAMVAKAVAEHVQQFQTDLHGMTQGAAEEVAKIEQQQAADQMQAHTGSEIEAIQNPHIRKEFVRELQDHAQRYHNGKYHKQADLESAIEMAKLKLGLIHRSVEEFIPKSYQDENAPPKNLDEVYGDYKEMSAGQLAQLMMDHPEEADKILQRRKRYLADR